MQVYGWQINADPARVSLPCVLSLGIFCHRWELEKGTWMYQKNGLLLSGQPYDAAAETQEELEPVGLTGPFSQAI